MPAELLEILKHNPEGMSSYFESLAEEHPALYVALIGRALPQLMDSGQPAGAMQLVYRSAEDIAKEFKERGLPEPNRIEFKSVHLAVRAVAKHDGERNAIKSASYRGEIGHGVLLCAVTGGVEDCRRRG